jgi:hypothetical protein
MNKKTDIEMQMENYLNSTINRFHKKLKFIFERVQECENLLPRDYIEEELEELYYDFSYLKTLIPNYIEEGDLEEDEF